MNHFRQWMKIMGFKVAPAAEALGIGKRRADSISSGKTELARCDRLAMAAVAVGLPEWTPENADMIDRIKRAADAVQGKGG